MLIGEIVAAVMVTALAATLLTRRVAHDDVHSVEGYHRSLHTLESINAHPTISGDGELSGLSEKSAHAESAVRVAGTRTVRVTGAGGSVPPVPPPPLADPDNLTFDDAEQPPAPPPPPEPRNRDKAMTSINRRPRRLAAPAMAVAGVLVLVVVLLLTGSHTVPPSRTRSTDTNSGHHRSTKPQSPKKKPPKRSASTTATTPPPTVSSPQAPTPQSATYDVAGTTFTMTLMATSGSCWVDATSSATGTTLFSGTLAAGAQRSFSATGPVTLIVGAPTVLHATVDGDAVVLPPGFQTPFTMSFVTTTATAPG